MRRTLIVLAVAAALLGGLGATSVWAQAPLKVGEVRSFYAETPHPYPLGPATRAMVWEDMVTSPGATFLRVHFRNFGLAPGDFMTVSTPDGSQSRRYTGRGPQNRGEFWSFAVAGDTAVVRIHGGRGQGHGYMIDKVGHGTLRLDPSPEVVCSIDGREPVGAHCPEVDAAQMPVARILYVSGAFQYVCTAWLATDGDAGKSTLVTNNHCISRQSEADTLHILFNYQAGGCASGGFIGTDIYGGGTLLKTNSVDRRGSKGGLDYSLISIAGNPARIWGELEPTAVDPSVGDLIWFIQHPGGGPKEIGYFEDFVGGARCSVDAVNQTYGRAARDSQTAYACDSEGGSSGSPIIEAATGRVIALHHFGGVSGNPCLNSGSEMSAICADAGNLLSCFGGGGNGGCTPGPGAKGDPCTVDEDCQSCSCKGKPGAKTCK